jgi:hypothetical protein
MISSPPNIQIRAVDHAERHHVNGTVWDFYVPTTWRVSLRELRPARVQDAASL